MLNRTILLFFLICSGAGLLFLFINSSVEFFFVDLKFLFAGSKYNLYDISRYATVILIDENSEQALDIPLEGKAWRQYDALLINLLREAGAAVIAYDIQFSHEETPWDSSLAEAIKQAGCVITGEDTPGITTPAIREAVYSIAAPDINTIGGIPRQVFKYSSRTSLKTISFAVLEAYARFLEKKDAARAADLISRLDTLDSFWINYKYPCSYFPLFSYVDVIRSRDGRIANKEQVPLSIFKNKIVLVAKDFPKDRIVLPNLTNTSYFGGLVHVYSMESFLQDDQLVRTPLYLDIILLFVALLAIQLLFIKAKPLSRYISITLLFVLYWAAGMLLFEQFHAWLPFAGFFLSSLLLIVINVSYKRRLLVRNFQKVKVEISRLEKYNSMLEEAAEMRDILTDTIVHDIKNSIAAVEGSLLYVSEKYKNDLYTLQTFHAANIACQDIINLSSNLLDVKTIEEGKMELVNQECPYGEIIDIITRFTGNPIFSEKKFNSTVIPPDFKTVLYADRYLLEQIIHNLLNNSFKYTSAGGTIRTEFRITDEEIIIVFFNSGIPITDDQKEIIFNKYIRLGRGRSRYSKGLGLYFCRMAMQMHNGRIWVETDEKGNYFNLGFKIHTSVMDSQP